MSGHERVPCGLQISLQEWYLPQLLIERMFAAPCLPHGDKLLATLAEQGGGLWVKTSSRLATTPFSLHQLNLTIDGSRRVVELYLAVWPANLNACKVSLGGEAEVKAEIV